MHTIASMDAVLPTEAQGDRFVRLVCVLFAASSFPLAAWMLIAPYAFWSGLGVGGNPFAEALYGGAIAGEGVMFLLGARRPSRSRSPIRTMSTA